MQWNDGYVSDIPYQDGLYIEQMPTRLNDVCLLNGVAAPAEAGAPFSYCELGCGLGSTASVIAAAHPRASVFGFDFNPAHIAHGRERAARAGLDNLVLAERSFEDLAKAPPGDMPHFDYVTLHGVWSWISPANRVHIVSFLRDRMAPGGLVSVSYNAMPGWAGAIPLQHLITEIGRMIGGDSGARVRGALSLLRRIVDTEGAGIEPKLVSNLESLLEKGEVSYVTHEYLNEHWAPAFFADVAAALAPAKLEYVGSATMLENFPQLCVRPDALALIAGLPAGLQQSVQDVFCPRTFRRDIFVRGRRPLSSTEVQRRLGERRLTLMLPAEEATCKIKAPIGTATLNQAFYAPALAKLGRGSATLDELVAAAPGTAPPRRDILGMLVGSSQALSITAEPEAAAMARVRRFNLSRINDAMAEGEQLCWLAGAAVGTAVRGKVTEMLIYQVIAAEPAGASLPPERIRADVVALMAERGMAFERGAASDGADRMGGEIEEFVAKILPIWQRIGVI